ncbi:hypothetical protein DPMN_073874 [Dreissena polymorpha]|uniref:Uncharacterized protein n=1 Tax=Dreissena polymorpha TaxID=45954 RepID=A0A9D4BK53_DREPO|nr:hypothetical protein DPMN_073874 [Dreissena polymorpha]
MDQLYTRLLEVQSQTQLPLRCRISNFDPIKTGVREHCVRPIPAQDDIVNLEGVQRYAACFITRY